MDAGKCEEWRRGTPFACCPWLDVFSGNLAAGLALGSATAFRSAGFSWAGLVTEVGIEWSPLSEIFGRLISILLGSLACTYWRATQSIKGRYFREMIPVTGMLSFQKEYACGSPMTCAATRSEAVWIEWFNRNWVLVLCLLFQKNLDNARTIQESQRCFQIWTPELCEAITWKLLAIWFCHLLLKRRAAIEILTAMRLAKPLTCAWTLTASLACGPAVSLSSGFLNSAWGALTCDLGLLLSRPLWLTLGRIPKLGCSVGRVTCCATTEIGEGWGSCCLVADGKLGLALGTVSFAFVLEYFFLRSAKDGGSLNPKAVGGLGLLEGSICTGFSLAACKGPAGRDSNPELEFRGATSFWGAAAGSRWVFKAGFCLGLVAVLGRLTPDLAGCDSALITGGTAFCAILVSWVDLHREP